MATVTRVNGLGHAHATLYNTANLGFYVIDIKADASAEGGIGKTLELLGQHINAIALNSEGTAGLVNAIVDASQWDAASLQKAVRAMGDVVVANDFDVSSADVTAGGQFIVSA